MSKCFIPQDLSPCYVFVWGEGYVRFVQVKSLTDRGRHCQNNRVDLKSLDDVYLGNCCLHSVSNGEHSILCSSEYHSCDLHCQHKLKTEFYDFLFRYPLLISFLFATFLTLYLLNRTLFRPEAALSLYIRKFIYFMLLDTNVFNVFYFDKQASTAFKCA